MSMTEPDKQLDNPAMVKSLGETILDIVSVILRWRRFILLTVLTTTLITGVVAFLLPKWYKATASVFPAEQANLFPGLEGVSSLVQSFSGKKLSSLTGPSETDRYMAILKSDRVLSEMINHFNLIEVYGYSDASYRGEKTAKDLIANTELELQDEGNLTISVYDKDPKRAAEMANYYVKILNETNSELQAQNAKGNRLFVEQRFEKNLTDLRSAEESLKVFQLKNGVLAMPEQTTASIKAGAEVYGQLAKKEIELDVLKRTLTPGHPNVEEKEIEVSAIKRKLKEMSEGGSATADEMKIIVPFRQTPELAVEYIRLFRNVEIQYKILQFITPVYEQSKVEENRSTPSVVVLDRATPPERKAKPKISMFMLLAFVISILFSLIVTFTDEAIRRIRLMSPEKYNSILSVFQSDWFGLKNKSSKKE